MTSNDNEMFAHLPDEIPIPERIGRCYFKWNGKPCCAVGHFISIANDLCMFGPGETSGAMAIRFAQVASIFTGERNGEKYTRSLAYALNDAMSAKDRLTCYLATLATIGYTEGNTNAALELAKKWEKKFGSKKPTRRK